MKHFLLVLAFGVVLTPSFIFSGCSNDDSGSDDFPGACFVNINPKDTLVLESGESLSIKVFYGKGVQGFLQTLVKWTTDNETLVIPRYNSVTAANDSCFAYGTVEAKSNDGISKVFVTFTLGSMKKILTLNIKTISAPIDTSATYHLPEGSFSDAIKSPSSFIKGSSFYMIPVKGGSFWQGPGQPYDTAYQYTESYYNSNHKWATVSDFYIGQTEVTNELWNAVMNTFYPPSSNQLSRAPVDRVSWKEIHKFLDKLNQLTGKNYRLPTESEWEFAARGGNNSQHYIFSGSNNIDDVGWCLSTEHNNITRPVMRKKSNELGIFDMSGNVSEFCSDVHKETLYNSDGTIRSVTERCILRGSKANSSANILDLISKSSCSLTERGQYLVGFRLVLTK